MEKIKRNMLSESTAKRLRKAILLGDLPNGYHLAEPELAKEFGTSRAPIRDALHILIREGFAERLPNGRVCVRNFTINDIENLFEFRYWLESQSIKKWIDNGNNPLPMDELHELIGKMNNSFITTEEFSEYDMEFHKAIVQLSDNKSILQAWNGLEEVIKSIQQITNQGNPRSESIVEHHLNLLVPLSQKKYEETCLVLKNHLEEAEKVMISSIKQYFEGTNHREKVRK